MTKKWFSLALIIGVFFVCPKTTFAMDASTLPLSGTFIMDDSMISSQTDLAKIYDEMAATGINTVIFLASGLLQTPCTPAIPSFTETYYYTNTYPWYVNSLQQAHAHNMTVYFGLVNSDVHGCTPFWVGTPGDKNTYMGRLLDYSNRLVSQVQSTVEANGWSWSDPHFAGFYLFEGGVGNFTDPNSPDVIFYKNLVSIIKAKTPEKKILLSPWVTDEYSYNQALSAYRNLYSIGIDIIAPQDSMGSLKVTSFAKSSELFKALQDATAEFPGKQAWANIETQLQPSAAGSNYNPSNIDRVSGQIEAASPHVSKMVTWIYQHTMLSAGDFDNIYSWTGQYTRTHADQRRTLRSAYLAKYSPKSVMYFYHKTNLACQATSSQYSDINLCQSNLNQYLPNLTTGTCYTSLAACQSANSTTYLPGDLNTDGKVNIFDYNLLVSKFGNPYSIFDYNNLVANYGKTNN